jgi:hypothetical protein
VWVWVRARRLMMSLSRTVVSACIQGHEGVGGWLDRAVPWVAIGIGSILLTSMPDRAGRYRRYERIAVEFVHQICHLTREHDCPSNARTFTTSRKTRTSTTFETIHTRGKARTSPLFPLGSRQNANGLHYCCISSLARPCAPSCGQ